MREAQAANANTESKTPIFEPDNPGFQEGFDEEAFEFKHGLTAGHPLFTRERLRRLLLSRATTNNVYYNAGEIRVDQRWDTVPPRYHKICSKKSSTRSRMRACLDRTSCQVHDDPGIQSFARRLVCRK